MVFYKNFIFLLSLVAISVWIAVFSVDSNLHIIACDVGQGDAILIQRRNTQILIDSGPNNKVLDCLGRHMPFWDKKIELAISTHIDKDHSGGFLEVYKSYDIENILTNDLDNPIFSTQTAQLLRNAIKNAIFPSDDLKLRVGVIHLDVLYPNSEYYSNNTNDYSIVNLLQYGQFKAVFTGDLELNISEDLFEKEKIGSVDYIKIAHHGSKNGTSSRLLEYLDPKIAVISVGKNSYGHPSPEVLKILNDREINILRTDQMGDVEVVTDGIKVWKE